MSLIDRILNHEALRDDPLVITDVGASDGIPAQWRPLARHAVGIGFDPDPREVQILRREQRRFRRWIFSPCVVTTDPDRSRATIFATRSPFCSSTLRPSPALQDWVFSDLFAVEKSVEVPSQTLAQVLEQNGLIRIDWLKCDTQGTDLRIYESLPASLRHRMHVVEFEPGLLDAYEGEDKAFEVLRAMEKEPFWLAGLEVNRTPRGAVDAARRVLGERGAAFYRDFGPGAPGWVNARYLRRIVNGPALELRDILLGWLFATMNRQAMVAFEVAEMGAARSADPIFLDMVASAECQMRRPLWRRFTQWPGFLRRRLRARLAEARK